MPSTLTGILILLFSFAPGYIYLLLSERQGAPLRTVSAFRETSQVILTSFLALTAAAAICASVDLALGERGIDLDALATSPGTYWAENVTKVFTWGTCLLLLACALSYMWGAHAVGRRLADAFQGSPAGRIVWPATSTSFASAWSTLLEVQEPTMHKYVRARLTDGTLVEGWLFTFNPHVSETADRELTLANPVTVTDPAGIVTVNDSGAVAFSARNVVYVDVSYHLSTVLDSGAGTNTAPGATGPTAP